MNPIRLTAEVAYDLIRIDDELTPLGNAPVPKVNYYGATAVVVIVALLILLLVFREVRYLTLKKRLLQIWEKAGITDRKVPNDAKSVKEEIESAEMNISATML